MTFAGKKLQDIYDSGSSRMAEVETTQSSALKENVKEHIQTRRSGKDLNVTTLEGKTKGLETELRSFMEASMARVKQTMEDEVRSTEDHLSGVKLELNTLSEKLKSTVSDLRRNHGEQVHHIHTTLSDQYQGAVETNTVELEKQNYVSIRRLRAHGTLVMNTLQQKLDHSLWESRGEEKQYNSALFKTFMQKANSIDTHFSTLMQKLSADFQTHFKVLEGQTQITEEDLNKSHLALFDQIDQHSSQLEQQVQDFYQTTLESHTRTVDASLGTIAQDLSSVHDTTTRTLTDQTRDLSSNLVASSTDARENLSGKCTDLRKQVDTKLEAFRNRLEDKAGMTASLRQTLIEERRIIFEKTRAELNSISEGFDKRITTLMTDAIARVHAIESEAERDINNAQIACINQLKNESTACKEDIDKAIAGFLDLVLTQKDLALQEISQSAEGSGGERKPEPKPKRSKK